MLIYVMIVFLAYLLGSIPFGYLLVRVFRGEDVRTVGSGNIGATNVARKAPALGLLTLLLDAAKGYAAVALAFGISHSSWNRDNADPILLMSTAALFAILGHVYPAWLRFKGGKGVATGVGAFLAVAPAAVAIVLVIFVVVVTASRYVSLASISATAAFPLFAWLIYRYGASPWFFAVTVAAAALIIVKHKDNIRRLLAGTEHRFELKRGAKA